MVSTSFTTAGSRGQPPQDTEVIETHISTLFFVGDYVYKLRKPVRFGFLDFTRRVDRLADCKRELALNRRLAPDVYIGVADLMLGLTPLDHVVVMRRLPSARRLGTLALEGAGLDAEVQEIARVLADFHARADRSAEISSAATAEALLDNWETNFSEVDRFVGTVLDSEREGRSERQLDAGSKAGRRCCKTGSIRVASATATATSRQTTSSASTTEFGSSTAWNSAIACATVTYVQICPFFLWISSVSGARRYLDACWMRMSVSVEPACHAR